MRRALLIIDVQEAMIPVLWRGAELVERLAKLARQARDHDVPVMMVQQTGPPGSPFGPTTPGWQPAAQLRLAPTDMRIHKTATDSFFDTELASALTGRAITTLIISGAATDYCVDATVRAAVSRGLGVDLVSDGHSPAISGIPMPSSPPSRSSLTTTGSSARRSIPAVQSASCVPTRCSETAEDRSCSSP